MFRVFHTVPGVPGCSGVFRGVPVFLELLHAVPLLPKIFHWNDPKSRVPFTFQPEFLESCCKW